MRILDRYVLSQYISVLIYSMFAIITIFIVFDLFEKLDDFIDFKVPLVTVLLYYLYSVPEILLLTLPVGMLLSCLFSLGAHSRNLEFVATLAAGIGMKRMLVPVLIAALMISALTLVFGETIAPAAALEAKAIRDNEMQKGRSRSEKVRSNVSYMGSGDWVYYLGSLDMERDAIRRITISQVVDLKLEKRIDAQTGIWEDGHWTLRNGFYRTFDDSGLTSQVPFTSRSFPELTESPSDLSTVQKGTKEMGYREFEEYIKKKEMSGGETQKDRVQLQMKLAAPFRNLIIVLLGCPLGALLRRGGNALGFSLALLIIFVYYIGIRVGQSLGYNEVVNPATAAWIANGVFLALGSVLFLRLTRQ